MSCHLHDEKFVRLTSAASTDLAGAHHGKNATVGCIACHGGADPGMRLAVWAVAGFDTVKFLAGAYREPTRMRLPLRDAECRGCHTPILGGSSARATTDGSAPGPPPALESTFGAEAETEGRGGTSYHAIREHDPVRIPCIRCHTSHTTDGDSAGLFISKARVAPLCRQCHREM